MWHLTTSRRGMESSFLHCTLLPVPRLYLLRKLQFQSSSYEILGKFPVPLKVCHISGLGHALELICTALQRHWNLWWGLDVDHFSVVSQTWCKSVRLLSKWSGWPSNIKPSKNISDFDGLWLRTFQLMFGHSRNLDKLCKQIYAVEIGTFFDAECFKRRSKRTAHEQDMRQTNVFVMLIHWAAAAAISSVTVCVATEKTWNFRHHGIIIIITTAFVASSIGSLFVALPTEA